MLNISSLLRRLDVVSLIEETTLNDSIVISILSPDIIEFLLVFGKITLKVNCTRNDASTYFISCYMKIRVPIYKRTVRLLWFYQDIEFGRFSCIILVWNRFRNRNALERVYLDNRGKWITILTRFGYWKMTLLIASILLVNFVKSFLL